MKRQQALAAGEPDDWAWESHLVAMKFIYKRLHIPKEPVEFPTSCSAAPPGDAARTWRIPGGYIESMQRFFGWSLKKADFAWLAANESL